MANGAARREAHRFVEPDAHGIGGIDDPDEDVHRARPFFASLTEFMSSGPSVVLVLEAEDAIKKWRTLMGATDPAKADPGTLRKEFADSIERNATHGSDAPETAAYEIGYFFAGVELI